MFARRLCKKEKCTTGKKADKTYGTECRVQNYEHTDMINF